MTFMQVARTVVLCVALRSVAYSAEVHVSPVGNDSNAGTVAAPVQTFATAQRLARGSRGSTVVFHAGTYYLTNTIHITAEDSGTDQSPVKYVAAPGEPVVLSGGS